MRTKNSTEIITVGGIDIERKTSKLAVSFASTVPFRESDEGSLVGVSVWNDHTNELYLSTRKGDSVYSNMTAMTSAQARDLAARLIAAADEKDARTA